MLDLTKLKRYIFSENNILKLPMNVGPKKQKLNEMQKALPQYYK